MGQITEDYVSLETAKLLKEKGFDEYYPFWYNLDKPLEGPFFYKEIGWYGHNSYSYVNRNIISAPTLQMAMKWLREKEIFVEITHDIIPFPTYKYHYSVFCTALEFYYSGDAYDSYEEACEAGIKYVLENLI